MSDEAHQRRLNTEAILLGYAMSRLDIGYLASRNLSTWNQAYDEASNRLGVPPASLKNLRDEFDPVHPNSRLGWHNRDLRPDRVRVLDEMADVGDEALIELVSRILLRDEEATEEAIDALAVVTQRPANVAERLLTGRRAEEYFLEYSRELIDADPETVVDMRQSGLGYDFGLTLRPEVAVEVKGLKQSFGGIQFTDREWAEASYRRENYWLVVVGNLVAAPKPRVFRDPHSTLIAQCRFQASITTVWQASLSVIE